tara:strand:+ start:13944 stop:15401 length:1458 start_codon:yes stop_codon:yes gene_type:complete
LNEILENRSTIGCEAIMQNPYRDLPSVDKILNDKRVEDVSAQFGKNTITNLARVVLEEQRAHIQATGSELEKNPIDSLLEKAQSLANSLLPLINATGVIIHTNLGRSPMAATAISNITSIAQNYSSLEITQSSGKRSSRNAHIKNQLCRLTGAEDAMVVNNNAAALLLALTAIAANREAVISRGQLVEIGGGFRIPEVMKQANIKLIEVGTTNRTYIDDYYQAITEQTSALLRVHSSNYRLIGYTTEPTISELAKLAQEQKIPLIDDVGSGALIDTTKYGLTPEPLVQNSVKAGADLVIFSGDKLIGGPQTGIIVGKKEYIKLMEQHPLSRALRIDKINLAGLIATLNHYEIGDFTSKIPIWKMISIPLLDLGKRAQRWVDACMGNAEVLASKSTIGGGTLPGQDLPTMVCAITPTSIDVETFSENLRHCSKPIITRISEGKVMLDPRTVMPEDDEFIVEALQTIFLSNTQTTDDSKNLDHSTGK